MHCLFIKTQIIGEQVIKRDNKAEADRFYNFPYAAVEEALSNAVYHKSYELGSPIEIQVWPDKIEMLSFPGPVPPLNASILKTQKRIIAREYRNRRIGDFLKELRLTEGRGTGLPSIYKAMADNGSPLPMFETDAEATYFLVTLPVHELVGKVTSYSDELQVKDEYDSELVESILSEVGTKLGLSRDQVGTKLDPGKVTIGILSATALYKRNNGFNEMG